MPKTAPTAASYAPWRARRVGEHRCRSVALLDDGCESWLKPQIGTESADTGRGDNEAGDRAIQAIPGVEHGLAWAVPFPGRRASDCEQSVGANALLMPIREWVEES